MKNQVLMLGVSMLMATLNVHAGEIAASRTCRNTLLKVENAAITNGDLTLYSQNNSEKFTIKKEVLKKSNLGAVEIAQLLLSKELNASITVDCESQSENSVNYIGEISIIK